MNYIHLTMKIKVLYLITMIEHPKNAVTIQEVSSNNPVINCSGSIIKSEAMTAECRGGRELQQSSDALKSNDVWSSAEVGGHG